MNGFLELKDRFCPHCETTKTRADFAISTGRKDGLQVYCNSCRHKRALKAAGTVTVKEKRCPTCKEVKPIDQFHKSRWSRDGTASYCLDCAGYRRIKAKYNLTREQYEKRFFEQGGLCAICKRPSVEKLCVDHDHKTNEVRDLLCGHCNRAIGEFGDNPQILAKAIEYLKKHGIIL